MRTRLKCHPTRSCFFFTPAFLFHDLTVRDECEELLVEFGPLHLFRKRAPMPTS